MNMRKLFVLSILSVSFGVQAYSLNVLNALAPGYFDSSQGAPSQPAQYDVLVWTVAADGKPDIISVAPSGVQVGLNYPKVPSELHFITVPREPFFFSSGISQASVLAMTGNAPTRSDIKMTAEDLKRQAINELGLIIKGNRSSTNMYMKLSAADLPADKGLLYLLPSASQLIPPKLGSIPTSPSAGIKDTGIAQYWQSVLAGVKSALASNYDNNTVRPVLMRTAYLNWLISVLNMFRLPSANAVAARDAFRSYARGALDGMEAKYGAVPKSGAKFSPGATDFFGTYVYSYPRTGSDAEKTYWYGVIKSTN